MAAVVPAFVTMYLALSSLMPGSPSGGPAAVVDTRPAAAAPFPTQQPKQGWQWPMQPRPTVVKRFVVGPQVWSAGHRGVDLSGAQGSAVFSAGDGTVAFVGTIAGRPVMAVDHRSGLRTTYEPVVPLVPVGSTVSAGTRIGTLDVAGSHCAPGACLHWGAKKDGVYLDPLRLLGLSHPILLPWRAHA